MSFMCFNFVKILGPFSCDKTYYSTNMRKLYYDVLLVRIEDHIIKQLWRKDTLLINVLWSQQEEDNTTWKLKSNTREMYTEFYTLK